MEGDSINTSDVITRDRDWTGESTAFLSPTTIGQCCCVVWAAPNPLPHPHLNSKCKAKYIRKRTTFIEAAMIVRKFAIAANPKKPQKKFLKWFRNLTEIETVTLGRQMVTLAAVWICFAIL